MNDLAVRAILPPCLALDANVIKTGGSQTLDKRGLRIKPCACEPWNKAYASIVHAANFWTVNGQVEAMFVSLSDT